MGPCSVSVRVVHRRFLRTGRFSERRQNRYCTSYIFTKTLNNSDIPKGQVFQLHRMPHKHRRKGEDSANYNLPPDIKARPLPVGKQAQTVFSFDDTKKPSNKRKRARADNDNDTPRAFSRLMHWSAQGGAPSGLDDGYAPRKKAKKGPKGDTATQPRGQTSSGTAPKAATVTVSKSASTSASDIKTPSILPGESLSEFSARVNAALPIAGLSRKIKDGSRQTRMEKKLQRGYAAWREEETRLRDKEDEARERAEEEEEERNAKYGAEDEQEVTGRASKRRRRLIGEVGGGAKDDDPWAELKEKRDRPKGLHDVALAPPQLKAVKEKFKTVGKGRRDAAVAMVHNVPGAGKSLKQREDLGEERRAIIERYRVLMRNNRA